MPTLSCLKEPIAPWQEMAKVGKWLYEKDLIAAFSGNLSFQLNDKEILITPSSSHLGFLEEESYALVNLDGHTLKGRPSSEVALHLEVYRRCPEARAVVHAHPPFATAWSLARPEWDSLPLESLSEGIPATGKIPIFPYAEPGTQALADSIHPHIQTSKVSILAHHGSLCWGTSLFEAFLGTERLEHLAKILYYAENLGGAQPLPDKEVARLHEIRALIGDRLI